MKTYPIVARKTWSLELEREKSIRPSAKIAVNIAMSFSTKSLELILARTMIATVGSRHATTVMTMNVTRSIFSPE